MTPRRVLMPAAFVAAVIASPVAAQEADPPAPPVVERVNRRAPAAAEGRASESGERYRAPEGARERVAAAPGPTPTPAAAPAFEEEQGGRRRPGGAGGGGRVAGGGGSGSRGGGSVAIPRQGGVRNPDADRGWNSGRQAVPRGAAPRPPQGGWGGSGRRFYGAPGGFGYYLYDPWSWYGWGWPGYAAYGGWGWGNAWGWGGWGNTWGGYWGGGVYTGPYGWAIGGVRLKVDQRDAEVYVDGYYAGTVNDFDGIWQQLRLDDGDYRIEVRKPGFDALVFDVRILPGRTITYRGRMVPAP